MPYYDDEATDKAVEAFFRSCKRQGFEPDQPNRYDTELVGDIVYIRSGRSDNNLMARYKVLEDGRVRRMKDLAADA